MGRKRVGGGNEDRRIVLDRSRLAALFSHGLTISEIAAELGCSTHPVGKALRSMGLSRPAARRKGKSGGANNPAWKGGRRVRPDGYVVIWTPQGERLEHQVVAELGMGRPLNRGEIVHHRDHNKQNNQFANLQVMTQAEHARHHAPDMHAARYGK